MNLTLDELLKLRELCETIKAGKRGWQFERSKFQPDYIGECCYLGDTTITLAQTYENHHEDCRFVEEACTNFPSLLDELIERRREDI